MLSAALLDQPGTGNAHTLPQNLDHFLVDRSVDYGAEEGVSSGNNRGATNGHLLESESSDHFREQGEVVSWVKSAGQMLASP